MDIGFDLAAPTKFSSFSDHFLRASSNILEIHYRGPATGSNQTPGGASVSGGTLYYISRKRADTTTTTTYGGVAGNAGRGQGYGMSSTAGAQRVQGGTNAGYSGKSGDGGDLGAAGQSGETGLGGGTGGYPGGAAGLAIQNPNYVSY